MSRSTRSLVLAGLLWVTTAATCGALSPFAEMLLARVEMLEGSQYYVLDGDDQIVGPVVDLEATVDFDDIVTCLPIVQEVLQGFRDESAYRRARDSMLSFPVAESPISSDVFLEAVGLYRAARRRGRTVRSSADCLIAACAIRHDLEVLHRDRDFGVLAEVSALRQRMP